MNGQLSSLVLTEALTKGGGLAVSKMLEGMGVTFSGTAAAAAIGAFVGGCEIGKLITGEDEAYEHARLAHFARFIQPGVAQQWSKLRRTGASGRDDLARMDATAQALLLLKAYVWREEASITGAYNRGLLGRLGMRTPATGWPVSNWTCISHPYQNWRTGRLFEDYAGELGGGGGVGRLPHGMIDLGASVRGSDGQAADINNDGEVVGLITEGSGGVTAFLWNPATGAAHELGQLLAEKGDRASGTCGS